MDFYLNSIIRIFILIVLAQSYNLVIGYAGIVHVGHIAFMAIGAYTSALLTLAGVPFWIGALSGILAAGLAGLLLGLPTVRFRDDYIVAATLGMGEIVRLIITNERSLTGGSTGLPKIARPEIFGIAFSSNISLVILAAFIAAGVLAVVWAITKSPFGKSLEAIREDEVAAESLGKNTSFKKVQVLVIGALFAGLAGVMDAHSFQFIDPDKFNIHMMIFLFLIVVFGGSGTFLGPIVGVLILYTLFEAMRFLPLPPDKLGPMRWIIYAVIFMCMIIYKPTGIMGKRIHKKKL